MHISDAPELLIRSVAALVGSGLLYISKPIIATLTDAPQWITTLGLPVAMLLLAIFGLVGLFKALSDERLARIADRDEYIRQLRDDAKVASAARSVEAQQARESREKLIAATIEQTHEFRGLKDAIGNRHDR